MANPSPQHTPTDGLGVAAYVHVSGTNVTNPSGGSLAHPGSNGANGQGIGATAGSSYPVAQYALTLSKSGSGGYSASETLTAALVDVSGASYSPVSSAVWLSYGDPGAGSPSWYRPSNAVSGNGAGLTPYSANIASVASTGQLTATIAALNVGQCIVEVQFPTFDNTIGNQATAINPGPPNPQSYNPLMMIYAQIVVTVIS
jgi:hypothetical protein